MNADCIGQLQVFLNLLLRNPAALLVLPEFLAVVIAELPAILIRKPDLDMFQLTHPLIPLVRIIEPMNYSDSDLAVKHFCTLILFCIVIIDVRHIRARPITELDDFIKRTDPIQVIFATPVCIENALHPLIQCIRSVELSTIRRNDLQLLRICGAIFFLEGLRPKLVQTHPFILQIPAGVTFHITDHGLLKDTLQLFLIMPEINAQILVDIAVPIQLDFLKDFLFCLFQRIRCLRVFVRCLLLLNKDIRKLQNPISIAVHPVDQLADVVCQNAYILRIFRLQPGNSIRKDTSTTNRRQLIRISDQNQTLYTIPVDRPEKCRKKVQVDHGTLINYDGVDILAELSSGSLQSEIVIDPSVGSQERVDCSRPLTSLCFDAFSSFARRGHKKKTCTLSMDTLDIFHNSPDNRGLASTCRARKNAERFGENLHANFGLFVQNRLILSSCLGYQLRVLLLQALLKLLCTDCPLQDNIRTIRQRFEGILNAPLIFIDGPQIQIQRIILITTQI